MPRNASDYTPMMQQYLDIKDQYTDAIVFFRLGDFYEMFFEDAHLASRELEIQLTGRDAGGKARVPMCGVPHHAVETYLNRLVNKGYKVAICEQVEEASADKKLVKRDVTRVVTPGTNIDDDDAAEHYLAAIGFSEYFYTLAYASLSTGELYTVKTAKDASSLINELSALSVREIIVSHQFDTQYIKPFAEHVGITISIHADTESDALFEHLYAHLPTPLEQKTVKRLLSYLFKTQKRALMHIKEAVRIEAKATMKMDANTIRSLELVKTMRQNHETGSLFWLLNKTMTAMGGRFLKRQLLNPLLDRAVLNTRYDFLDALNREFIVAGDIRERLKNVYDLERIIGRVSYGNTNAKDLVQLRKSLEVLPDLKADLNQLKTPHSEFLSDAIDVLEALLAHLESALKDDVPLTIREGNMIKEGYSQALDALRDIHLNTRSFLERLEAEERERTNIKKLKIGYNRVFGYYIEVPKGQIQNVKDEFGYVRKQTLANAERYITETLKEKEQIILSSEEKSVKLETELFLALRDTVRKHISAIQKNAEIMSEVDMFIALSHMSEQYRFVRPVLHEKRAVHVKNARHPVVERVLDAPFVANDIVLDDATDIALITGPNMSGKSTYMRTLGVIAILAQIGSFVPAEEANLPIFDKLFTRIGTSDDLLGGKSTFMVEMLDANHAIQNATADSLILFDEIGRGTSTYDGLAIAQAIIEYIHENIRCKTLFATHYHELTELENTLEHLKNIHVAAADEDGRIVFLYQVRDGRADKSYGINVAGLAQLPPSLIRRSKKILEALETNRSPSDVNLFSFLEDKEEAVNDHPHQDVLDELDALDVDELKPIDALNTLHRWISKIKRRP